MRDVIIIGAGGHAVSVADTVLANGRNIRAFVSESPETKKVLGFPVVNPNVRLELDSTTDVVLAIGDNSRRERVWEHYVTTVGEARLPALIHPSATISTSAVVSPGTVIQQGAIIGSSAQVGYACLVNTGAILDHESVLEDFASLAPGVVIGGRVRIRRWSAISIGATVLQDIHIGDHAVIGAMSLVNQSIPARVVAYGIPAKVVRRRNPGDPYLGLARDRQTSQHLGDEGHHA